MLVGWSYACLGENVPTEVDYLHLLELRWCQHIPQTLHKDHHDLRFTFQSHVFTLVHSFLSILCLPFGMEMYFLNHCILDVCEALWICGKFIGSWALWLRGYLGLGLLITWNCYENQAQWEIYFCFEAGSCDFLLLLWQPELPKWRCSEYTLFFSFPQAHCVHHCHWSLQRIPRSICWICYKNHLVWWAMNKWWLEVSRWKNVVVSHFQDWYEHIDDNSVTRETWQMRSSPTCLKSPCFINVFERWFNSYAVCICVTAWVSWSDWEAKI